MIVESVLNLLFGLVEIVINLVPGMNAPGVDGVIGMSTLLSYALTWFPLDLWIALIANIGFWLTVQIGWIVIEWTYNKIPGVN